MKTTMTMNDSWSSKGCVWKTEVEEVGSNALLRASGSWKGKGAVYVKRLEGLRLPLCIYA